MIKQLIGDRLNYEITKDADWLKQRALGLGATDIAVIAGASKYVSLFELWKRKKDCVEIEVNQNMARGIYFEEPTAKLFAFQTGYEVFNPNQKIFVSEENSRFMASPDYFYQTERGLGYLEIKTHRGYISDSMDAHYIQLQWNLYVTGLEFGTVAYLDSSFDIKHYEYIRDEPLIEQLKIIALEFLESIDNDIEPEAYSLDDVKSKYAESTDNQIEATGEIVEKYEKLKKVKVEIKDLEIIKDDLELAIKQYMQDNERLVIGNKVLATWKSSKPTERYDYKSILQKYDCSEFKLTSESTRRFTVK